jgi:SSS family solute:Na+ symporter
MLGFVVALPLVLRAVGGFGTLHDAVADPAMWNPWRNGTSGWMYVALLAPNIGVGSTVGAAGLGYQNGLAAWWWVGSAGIGSLVLALWVGPRIWRIAAAHDMRTVGDFLEWRFDARVRATIAILLWVGTIAILAGQLIGIAWILEVVTGAPKIVGCALGGVLVITYFAAGGLVSSAAVNVVQLAV